MPIIDIRFSPACTVVWEHHLNFEHGDQMVGRHQSYKYLKSQGAADKNASVMEILIYSCECQLLTVGTYYWQPVCNNYDQLLSLGALSSQHMQSKSKKIIQKILAGALS